MATRKKVTPKKAAAKKRTRKTIQITGRTGPLTEKDLPSITLKHVDNDEWPDTSSLRNKLGDTLQKIDWRLPINDQVRKEYDIKFDRVDSQCIAMHDYKDRSPDNQCCIEENEDQFNKDRSYAGILQTTISLMMSRVEELTAQLQDKEQEEKRLRKLFADARIQNDKLLLTISKYQQERVDRINPFADEMRQLAAENSQLQAENKRLNARLKRRK